MRIYKPPPVVVPVWRSMTDVRPLNPRLLWEWTREIDRRHGGVWPVMVWQHGKVDRLVWQVDRRGLWAVRLSVETGELEWETLGLCWWDRWRGEALGAFLRPYRQAADPRELVRLIERKTERASVPAGAVHWGLPTWEYVPHENS